MVVAEIKKKKIKLKRFNGSQYMKKANSLVIYGVPLDE
jgi:hypothetical protein